MTASETQPVAASIVVGHDGSVWYVAIDDPRIATALERSYNELANQFGERAEVMAVDELLEYNETHHLFIWRRLR